MSEEEGQEPEGTEEETPVVEEPTPVTGNANDAINASLEDIDDPVLLKKMLKSLRGENAKSRLEKNAKESELTEFRAWKESQMTELEKANARADEAEAKAAEATRRAIIKEFDIDEDLQEFLVGATEDEIRAKAEKLAKRAAATGEGEKGQGVLPAGTTNLRPGKRGTPVGKAKTSADEGAEFLEDLWNTSFR